MKTAIAAGFAGICLASMALAETRVRLDARTEANARITDQEWKTDWGSYDRDVFRLRQISARVQCTVGEERGVIVVQWIGRDTAKNSAAALVAREEKPITLKPGADITETFKQMFAESDAKYKALGERDRSGHKFGGWIVRVLGADGKVLAEQTSSTPLLKKFAADAKAPGAEAVPAKNRPE